MSRLKRSELCCCRRNSTLPSQRFRCRCLSSLQFPSQEKVPDLLQKYKQSSLLSDEKDNIHYDATAGLQCIPTTTRSTVFSILRAEPCIDHLYNSDREEKVICSRNCRNTQSLSRRKLSDLPCPQTDPAVFVF